jgi:hypothetical protein
LIATLRASIPTKVIGFRIIGSFQMRLWCRSDTLTKPRSWET